MSGPRLFDGGADLTCGVIDGNDVSTGQVVPATRPYGAANSGVSGLDNGACLRVILHQARRLEEPAGLDASRY